MQHARLCVADVEALTRARDGHIHQAAFFFQRFTIQTGVFVWKQPFFQPANKYRVKFQPLGGVYRHQLHRVLPCLRLVVARFQRGMGQEGL